MTRSANCARYVEIDRYVISKRWDATTNEQHERLGSISWRLSIPVGAFLLRETTSRLSPLPLEMETSPILRGGVILSNRLAPCVDPRSLAPISNPPLVSCPRPASVARFDPDSIDKSAIR